MDKITILTCVGENYKATKEFRALDSGIIIKIPFSAGTHFTHEEKEVNDIYELATCLDELLNQPKKFVIRGQIKDNIGPKVRRKIHDADAAFDSCPRKWVMLDIDKQPCPEYFDVANNPEEAIKWVIKMLPKPFHDVTCYYKFSSSQSVPDKIGDKLINKISAHLWFLCEVAVSEQEWKHFFVANPSPVDQALFSAVQIHYTSKPIFIGFDDPLKNRSGILKGTSDELPILDIPPEEPIKSSPRKAGDITISEEASKQAIELLLPYYNNGSRNKFCSTIAGVLYRGGWFAENAADFVYELACKANDEEANARYETALRICYAIDNNRPAQGIPKLKEFKINNLDEILCVLGLGKPDIDTAISSLRGCKDIDQVKKVMSLMVGFENSKQKSYINEIHEVTKIPNLALKAALKEVIAEEKDQLPTDIACYIMDYFLDQEFQGGKHLLRASDGRYWQHNSKLWGPVTDEYIENKLLPYIREAVTEYNLHISVSSMLTQIKNIMPGRVFDTEDHFSLSNANMPSVINCNNGELWFDKNANIEFLPHRSESYIRYCLDVDYNPNAKSPMFDKAILEIFSGDSNMVRHFLELAGYICQPWRKIPIIVLLYGGGSNGKSSLMGVVQKVLGSKMIMADRIGNIEESPFKIGALDGKLMLIDDDVDESTLLPDGFLKKISEEKPLTGQHKHKPSFEFICRAIPVMLSNNYPATRDLSEGLQRRMLIIPFQRQFKKEEIKIGLFDDIWDKEASGILNHLIEGFQRLKQRGHFDEPEQCLVAKTAWFQAANILPLFVEECIDEGGRELLGDVYIALKQYCDMNGFSYIPTQPKLGDRLEKLGYAITKGGGGKKYVNGLTLKREFKKPAPIDFK